MKVKVKVSTVRQSVVDCRIGYFVRVVFELTLLVFLVFLVFFVFLLLVFLVFLGFLLFLRAILTVRTWVSTDLGMS